MNSSGRRAGAAIATAFAVITLALAACSTAPTDGSKVASTLPAECPVGTHICRRTGSTGPTQSVDSETMRNQGISGFGTPQAGPAIRNGAGS